VDISAAASERHLFSSVLVEVVYDTSLGTTIRAAHRGLLLERLRL
jgi:hypothetical protein